MNIQSTRGKVLTATVALLKLTRKVSKRKSATIFDFFGGLSGGKMVMMVRHVNGGETCGTVLQYLQAESVKYDTCFQKSSYLPWRLKFGHLGASGYQIYFSVYRVDVDPLIPGPIPSHSETLK